MRVGCHDGPASRERDLWQHPLDLPDRDGHISHQLWRQIIMAVAEAIEILASQHTTSTAIEVLPAGVRIRELDVPKKIVAEFLADVMPLDRADRIIQALEVGVFCLERAEATRDLDFVRGQVESILQE